MRRVHFNDKLTNTVLAVLVFLVASQLQLYGINRNPPNRIDPLYWMRPMLASPIGTLMEIGVQPLITASMSMQLLSGARLISIDYRSRQDRDLFHGFQKMVAIMLTFVWAAGSLVAGMHGDFDTLGYFKATVILTQLMTAGILVILLDEMLQKGYGLGTGITAFVGTNVCGTILNKTFGFSSISTAVGQEYEGCVVNFFYSLFAHSNKLWALQHAFFRSQAPNLIGMVGTAAIMLAVIWVQCYRV